MKKVYIYPCIDVQDFDAEELLQTVPNISKTAVAGGSGTGGSGSGSASSGPGGGPASSGPSAKANNLWDFEEEDFDTDW